MEIFLMIFSFILGSLPFGYIIVKLSTGKDIRKEGSGNIGSTNVKRVAGIKVSITVQVLDILKGLLPVLIYKISGGDNINIACIIASLSVMGHIFSPFLKFKGGKGINTTLGAFILICPIPVLLSVLIHVVLKVITNIVSVRSIILSLAIPIISYIMKYDLIVVEMTFIISLIIIYAHRENIKRLIKKEEF